MSAFNSFSWIRNLTRKSPSWSHINYFFCVFSAIFEISNIPLNLIKRAYNIWIYVGFVLLLMRSRRWSFFNMIIQHFPYRKTLLYKMISVPHQGQRYVYVQNIGMSNTLCMQKIYLIHHKQRSDHPELFLDQKLTFIFTRSNLSNYSFDGTIWGNSVSLRLISSISKKTAPGIRSF